ncbi:hypothetical protein [Streptomyces tsukubensis]|uniref:Uncharacterized protein n=1 Tax=Streptomyces tsukubensis TaxID=83656 RepID=A0A1V4AAE4_9ACTN|nr:hypothetical protein [Streptomyces tsukubensis]OON80037.1 hypothetical protein B1H18_12700 [Streptomyces tsukubensis]QFR97271.1 hypothetical protein GBW32_34665 [Streptomyces tsukubensis]
MTDIPPVLTVTAVSTIEPTTTEEGHGPDAWMVVETAEKGQLLLNLPGPLSEAMDQAAHLSADQAGPGRLALTEVEIAAYRERVAGLTSAA